jgi:hypothetical protein
MGNTCALIPNFDRLCPTVHLGRDTAPDEPPVQAVQADVASRPFKGLDESLPARQGDSRGRRIPSPAPMASHSLADCDGNGRPEYGGTARVSLGVKPRIAAGHFRVRTRQVTFRRRLERLGLNMSTPMLGSAMPRRLGFAVPRRSVSMLFAALLGLILALNPMSTPHADAAVTLSLSRSALRVAAAERGVPYRNGGSSPSGFDCSGLTQYSYARIGRHLPRTAQQQYAATIHIPWNQRRMGDLVFFYSGSTIYHVGVYSGNWYMIAAPHTGARVMTERIWSTHVVFGRVR